MEARRCAGLQPSHLEPDGANRLSERSGRRFAVASRRALLRPNVDKAIQGRPGGDDKCVALVSVAAFHRLAETEGILPALEPAHALARALDLDAELVLVGLSGRGDKDLAEVLEH
jgi:hypothetical protein